MSNTQTFDEAALVPGQAVVGLGLVHGRDEKLHVAANPPRVLDGICEQQQLQEAGY